MSQTIKKALVVAFYDNFDEAKLSVRKLKKYGVDIKKLSIAGKGYHPGSSLFMISGLGPLAVSGPLVTEIISAFEQGVPFRSLRAFHEGLYSIGIPKESVFQYESAVKNGLRFVCARSPAAKMAECKRVFALSKAIKITAH